MAMDPTTPNRRTEENRAAASTDADALPPQETWLRPGEAAEYLHISRSTLLRYVAKGIVERGSRTAGRHGRYKVSDLLKVREELAGEAAPASAGAIVCANCGAPLPGENHTCTTRVERPAALATPSEPVAA
jgi:excisionase family DNA binding protein